MMSISHILPVIDVRIEMSMGLVYGDERTNKRRYILVVDLQTRFSFTILERTDCSMTAM